VDLPAGGAVDDDRFAELRAALGSFDGDGRWQDRALVRRAGVVVGGVLAVAAVVLGWSWVRPVGSAPVDVPPRAVSSSSSSSSSSSLQPEAPAVARVWPSEPVEVVGTEVRTGGHRWSVGEAGDLVAVGDWDCDGTPTPAVLRPSVAAVFVFDGWSPADGSATSARRAAAAPADAVSFAATGCGTASVRTAGGVTVTIDVGVGG
jgi:hypothetical protein